LDDSYKTIKTTVQTEIKIKRSKFIATVFFCDSKDEAEKQIEEISKKYYNATHNCFAYKLLSETGEELFRYSDDGEPSGTAGRPIYDTLGSFGIHNVGLVVTRYYGGVKLGTGGLAHAYKDSARMSLEKADIKEVLIVERYRIAFQHNLTSIVLRTLTSDGVIIVESNYTTEGEIICDIRLSKVDSIRQTLISKSNARIKITKI
jgi:uncharacterized YigZ family protein